MSLYLRDIWVVSNELRLADWGYYFIKDLIIIFKRNIDNLSIMSPFLLAVAWPERNLVVSR